MSICLKRSTCCYSTALTSIYTEVLRLIESRLRPSAFIVADNIDNSPEYLAHVRSPENGYLSLPFRQDVELTMRIG